MKTLLKRTMKGRIELHVYMRIKKSQSFSLFQNIIYKIVDYEKIKIFTRFYNNEHIILDIEIPKNKDIINVINNC